MAEADMAGVVEEVGSVAGVEVAVARLMACVVAATIAASLVGGLTLSGRLGVNIGRC